ncbi:MAG TPA: MoaD/ThiS family protein [Acidimicrobiia bacterium]|nr:MoaD/ThiS family protein [Acidimicrobiia bacterium]
MSTVRLPRMLSETAGVGGRHEVTGETVGEALDHLFERAPGLRNHVLDESGVIRPHVSVFVDGEQADLETEVGPASEIRILHAVSGG